MAYGVRRGTATGAARDRRDDGDGHARRRGARGRRRRVPARRGRRRVQRRRARRRTRPPRRCGSAAWATTRSAAASRGSSPRAASTSRASCSTTRHPTGLYVKDPGNGVLYYRRGPRPSHLAPADADAVSFDGIDIAARVGHHGRDLGIRRGVPRPRHRRARTEHGVPVSASTSTTGRALWDAASRRSRARSTLARARRHRVRRPRRGRDAVGHRDGGRRCVLFCPRSPELVVKDGDVGATAFVGDR